MNKKIVALYVLGILLIFTGVMWAFKEKPRPVAVLPAPDVGFLFDGCKGRITVMITVGSQPTYSCDDYLPPKLETDWTPPPTTISPRKVKEAK